MLSGSFPSNHLMPGINRHNHADQRSACKIPVCGFHAFAAGVKGCDHGDKGAQ